MTELRSGLRQLLAPNPSLMTGPGTNTYLLGDDQVLVVDPGPAIAEHVEALVEATNGAAVGVLVTHHHSDHSESAREVAKRLEVPLLAFGFSGVVDPDRRVEDEEPIAVAGFSVTALHTPGHASDHLCLLVSAEAAGRWETPMLFTGDHVMGASTVVIGPLDGDMSAYLANLSRLIDLGVPNFVIAPGHGPLIPDGYAELRHYLDHRLVREASVLEALRRGPATPAELVPLVYEQLHPGLVHAAAASTWAHLRRLRELGRATTDEPDVITARWAVV